MPKKIKKSNVDFSQVFQTGGTAEPKKAQSLLDLLDGYIYETFNRSKKDMENAYGGKLVPCFHPSKLGKAHCVRQMVLEYLNVEFEEEVKFHSAATHRVFQNGHDVHSRLQKYIAALGEFTKGSCQLIGRWRCSCGAEFGYRKTGKSPDADYWVPKPAKCKKCGGDRIKYTEVGLSNPALRVYGKADGVLEWKGERWLIEIKSMNPFQYQKLIGPPDYYLPQANIYMWLSGIHKIIWIFEDKATQSWRDFITMFDNANIEPVIRLLEKANADINLKAVSAPEYPEGSVKCKACEYRRICRTFVNDEKYWANIDG